MRGNERNEPEPILPGLVLPGSTYLTSHRPRKVLNAVIQNVADSRGTYAFPAAVSEARRKGVNLEESFRPELSSADLAGRVEVAKPADAPAINYDLVAQALLTDWPGRYISENEIRKRLRKLKDAKYPLEPYSSMKSHQLFGYFMRLRRGMSDGARKYASPSVVENIDAYNNSLRNPAFAD